MTPQPTQPTPIRRCELKMTLAVLEAMGEGCELELYRRDNGDRFVIRGPECQHCGCTKPGAWIESSPKLKNLHTRFSGGGLRLSGGPWLAAAIEEVRKELGENA